MIWSPNLDGGLELHYSSFARETLDEGRLEQENVLSKENGSQLAGYKKLVPYLTPYDATGGVFFWQMKPCFNIKPPIYKTWVVTANSRI